MGRTVFPTWGRESAIMSPMNKQGKEQRTAGCATGVQGRADERSREAQPRPALPWGFPVAVVLGYGLFRGVNANSYLSAFASVEAPFLFVSDLFFNVVVACAVVVCALILIALTLRGRLAPLSMPYVVPTVLLLVANVCSLFGVFSWMPSDFALLLPGVLFGVASVMLSLVWVEVLACQDPRAIVTQIALSMLVNVVTSSSLSTLSSGARMVASCVVLAVMAWCAYYVRRVLRAQAEGERGGEVGGLAGGGERAKVHPVRPARPAGRGSYRDAFLELGNSIVAFCVMEAVIGLLNSFMLAGSIEFAGSDTVSVAGMLTGVAAFCIVVFVVQRIPRVSTAFRLVMPVIASLLVFLPFLGEQYNLFFSLVLLGSYYFIALLVTYVVAETAHERRVSPYVLMGAAAALARVCLAVALVTGYTFGSLPPGGLFGEAEDTMRYLVVIMAVIYALSLAAVLVSRDRRRRRGAEGAGGEARGAARGNLPEGGEGAAGGLAAGGATGEAPAIAAEGSSPAAPTDDAAFDARCARLAERGGLTEREAEILGYLARGRTNAYIATTLFVSENTVRSHVRNLYAKLDVHTRQQLIDLVEAERTH